MPPIFFNPHAFSVMDVLPPDDHFTARGVTDQTIMLLAQGHSIESGDIAQRRAQIHFDNSTCHTATIVEEQMAISSCAQVPGSIYSPDVAIAELCLFGKIKEESK
jgi:hypothetical protein